MWSLSLPQAAATLAAAMAAWDAVNADGEMQTPDRKGSRSIS